MILMYLKMKLINNWKRKLNLWNQLLKLLKMANDENPRLIIIGSILNDKERKDLKAEFQEVFARS